MPEPRERRIQPIRRAAALRYDSGDNAPRITASGSGYVAARIVEVARELGIPVKSDPALAKALALLDLGSEVPEEMYRAVAEALAWAYRLDATRPR
ncbi:MAG: EscU/YscU/HrcU family type III secretion system export apparatus switch protein [Solirubrobacteraceae bacterium]|jgi:flagellar biosynthesis protein